MCPDFSFELRGILRPLANKARNLTVDPNIWAAVIFLGFNFQPKIVRSLFGLNSVSIKK